MGHVPWRTTVVRRAPKLNCLQFHREVADAFCPALPSPAPCPLPSPVPPSLLVLPLMLFLFRSTTLLSPIF
jgi:hypothetical protein